MVDAKTNNSQKKIYVLDTSVLLSSPYAIFAFDEHVVWIPYNVITDLDAMRKTTNEASKNAQEALRIIEELRERGNLREGVPLKSGGIVCVGNSRSQSPIEAAQALPSNRIVIIVSNSTAVRIMAEEAGFRAEGYRSDSVDTENRYLGSHGSILLQ